MNRNQHALVPGVSAWTWRDDDGWYGFYGNDDDETDQTDDQGPYATEAECLKALRDSCALRAETATDTAEEAQCAACGQSLGSSSGPLCQSCLESNQYLVCEVCGAWASHDSLRAEHGDSLGGWCSISELPADWCPEHRPAKYRAGSWDTEHDAKDVITVTGIRWQNLIVQDTEGEELQDARRITALREFQETGAMRDRIFSRMNLPHEIEDDCSTWGPQSPGDVEWDGFPAPPATSPAGAWERWLSNWTPEDFWHDFRSGDQGHPWDWTAEGAVTNYCEASLNDGATEADLPTMAERDLLAEHLRQHCPEATDAATTPADAYERWVGSQSVSEFLGDDTPETAVDSYITEITAHPHGGPVEQYGCEPTERERDLLVEYVRLHAPVPPGDLIGSTEVAKILGWDRRKVSVYHGRGVLPAPVRELASGPVWRRQDIERYAVEHKLGVNFARLAATSDDDRQMTLDLIRRTYSLTTDSPIGAQLAAQGLLSEEQAGLLDSLLPVFDNRGRVIDYDAAVNLMDDELREELHDKLPPCSRQAFLIAYAEAHKARFGEDFPPYHGGAW
jgi:hypothetical protein